MGAVDDGDDELAFGVEGAGFGDETCFNFVVGALGFEFNWPCVIRKKTVWKFEPKKGRPLAWSPS